jgi:hypothetical protein
MDLLQAHSQRRLRLAEVVALAREAGLPSTPDMALEEEVTCVLSFMHSLLLVMWYDEPGLRDVVVLVRAPSSPPPCCSRLYRCCGWLIARIVLRAFCLSVSLLQIPS